MTRNIACAIAGALFTLTAGIAGQVAHATPSDTPHDRCHYEDGSGQRVCIWDAGHQGNGVGQSFIAVRGGTDHARYIRISHAKAHRLTH